MTRTPLTTNLDGYEVWFLTGSQHLYGPETLKQVAEQSQRVAETLDAASDVPVKIVWKPVLTDSEAIRRTALEANAADNVIGLVAWMHTFSPAKMWIAGLDALQKPLAHLHTQDNVGLPWGEIDFDFMNLNQAAHGDREFGYIQTRLGVPRKTVVGHASDPRVQRELGTWQRAAAGLAASRNLKLARFGDNMRYVAVTEGDKTEAELRLGVQVNTWGVNELAEAVAAASDADVDALVAEYEELYEVVPELRKGGDRHQSLRDGAAIELGLRSFLEEGGFGAFTTSFEDLGALKQLPGSPCSASWPRATASVPRATGRPRSSCGSRTSWARGSPAARASWRTTPTTSRPVTSSSSARTCSRSRRRSRRRSRPSRSTRSASAARRIRYASSSRPTRVRPSSSR